MENGKYTQEELDLLRMYTGRDAKGPIKYRSEINEVLGINEFSNKIVNTFLGTNGREPKDIYYDMRTGKDLREFLGQIEILFGIMCKYGIDHKLPTILYREENQHKDILRENSNTAWVTTSFKSCSTDRAEAEVFKSGIEDGSHMLCIKTSQASKVPFVNVNDILNDRHRYDDEKEILLSPFVLMYIDEETQNSSNTSVDQSDYIMHLSSSMIDPSNKKIIPQFNYEEHNISDEELDMVVNLQRKASKTAEELLKLEILLNKMQTYLMTRFVTIKTLYMEKPIIVEGKITKSDSKFLNVFGCNIPGVSERGTFFTLSDLLEASFSGKPSTLDNLTIVEDDQLKITPRLVCSILNSENFNSIKKESKKITPAQAAKNALKTGVTSEKADEAYSVEQSEQNLEKNNKGVTKDD